MLRRTVPKASPAEQAVELPQLRLLPAAAKAQRAHSRARRLRCCLWRASLLGSRSSTRCISRWRTFTAHSSRALPFAHSVPGQAPHLGQERTLPCRRGSAAAAWRARRRRSCLCRSRRGCRFRGSYWCLRSARPRPQMFERAARARHGGKSGLLVPQPAGVNWKLLERATVCDRGRRSATRNAQGPDTPC